MLPSLVFTTFVRGPSKEAFSHTNRAHGPISLQRAVGVAFGMWNLIGEIGAVLSPAISGVLRDTTGSWNTAVMVDAGIILASIVLLLFVRESRAASAEQFSEIEATS